MRSCSIFYRSSMSIPASSSPPIRTSGVAPRVWGRTVNPFHFGTLTHSCREEWRRPSWVKIQSAGWINIQAAPTVLTSMPGVGVRTAALPLTKVTANVFAPTTQLAAYAGLAPVTRRSGLSISGERIHSDEEISAQASVVPICLRGPKRLHIADLLCPKD